MPDREKVITDAEKAIKILDMIDEPTPWCDFVRIAFGHALELLKTQEHVEPYIKTSRSGTSWWYSCGNCNRAIDPNDKYCRNCGRAVKWE